MADLLNIADVTHYWGNDLQLSATGDLDRSIQVERSKQHVLRRLLTNPGGYLAHLEYGAGLPTYVGSVSDPKSVEGVIRGQMALEKTVQPSPAPVIGVTQITNGISANIAYVAAPEAIPAVLSFDVTQ